MEVLHAYTRMSYQESLLCWSLQVDAEAGTCADNTSARMEQESNHGLGDLAAMVTVWKARLV